MSDKNRENNDHYEEIDDLEIIELDDEEEEEVEDSLFHRMNWHIVLAVCFVIFIGLIIRRVYTYVDYISMEELDKIESGESQDNLDYVLPLINNDNSEPIDDGVTTVVAFGNAPFADDRNSSNSLANLITDLSGAEIINCSVSGSYLTALNDSFRVNEYPMDAFNLYWLTTLFTVDNHYIYDQYFQVMGEDAPEDAKEVYQVLSEIDFDYVDVITIMYDASDYLEGRNIYSDSNPTDITYFTGNLEASLELIQTTYPHIRIIVMSPSYAFAIDENGDYISSDIHLYGAAPLGTYVDKLAESSYGRSVSFVDHLLGTINEDNARDYLVDNLHLNKKGRELVAERFVYFLTYYDESPQQDSSY